MCRRVYTKSIHSPERGHVVLAGSVVALEDAGDGGDLVEAEHCPRHVGQNEHHEDDHHYHRHSDLSPVV